MSDPAADRSTGDPIVIAGRYHLGVLLGSGGMADVYQATDTRLHRQVAVKILRRTDGESESVVRARFAAEGLMVAKLNHPRVVSIFDAGEQDDQAFLIMECMPGNTLRDEMREQHLAEAQIRSVVMDVLDALDAAHQAGLVHRDVKPGNILATTDGRWKVADFGIAQAEGPVPGAEDLTSTGLLVGTPRYIAPERYAGHRATVASDLYSVGVILAELLEGSKHRSPALAAVASRARAIDPTQRFASAASMATAIRDAVSSKPSTPSPPAVTAVLPRTTADASTAVAASEATAVLTDAPHTTVRFRWWATAAAAAVVLLAVAAYAVGLGTSGPDGPPATGDEAPAITTTSTLTTTSTMSTSTTAASTSTSAPSTPAPDSDGESPGKGNEKDEPREEPSDKPKPKPKGKT